MFILKNKYERRKTEYISMVKGKREVGLEYPERQKIDKAIQKGAKCPHESEILTSWKHGCPQGQTRTREGDG